MRKTVIGLVGYSGAGKTTFSGIVKNSYGIPVISTGGFVREEISARGLELTSENVTKVSNRLRRENGGVFMRALSGKIEDSLKNLDAVVIDCLREINDYKELKRIRDRTIIVVNISTPDMQRYLRVSARKRERGAVDMAKFRKLMRFEDRLGIKRLVQLADYNIVNEGNERAFEIVVRDLLKRMQTEHRISLRKAVKKK